MILKSYETDIATIEVIQEKDVYYIQATFNKDFGEIPSNMFLPPYVCEGEKYMLLYTNDLETAEGFAQDIFNEFKFLK